ncbi:MAG: uroporphyrinogen-III synthase [Pseudomonadota bacterium]
MTPLSVIITRAHPGAEDTAKAVAALGFKSVLSPMLTLQRDTGIKLPAPERLAGLVFTSANGVRFYADAEQSRALPAWCVGPATAEAARLNGFESVHESAGDSVALAHFIAANTKPEARPLLHVANAAATGELKQTLDTLGFKTEFAPLYHALPVTSLPDETVDALAPGKRAILLIHSRKGADAFMAAAKDVSLTSVCAAVISARAAAPLKAADMDKVEISEAPNEDGLIAALKHLAATLSA